MLTMPVGARPYFNILGIDPGTHNLGVGILTVEFGTFEILASVAFTITALKVMPKDAWAIEMHGERTSRIYTLMSELDRCFNFYNPIRIACESPFYNPRRPMAYGSLVEILSAIRTTVWNYDRWRRIQTYDPPSVKKAVGAKGGADKDVMKEKVTNMSQLRWSGPYPITALDEHAIDGLAVAYADYLALKELAC